MSKTDLKLPCVKNSAGSFSRNTKWRSIASIRVDNSCSSIRCWATPVQLDVFVSPPASWERDNTSGPVEMAGHVGILCTSDWVLWNNDNAWRIHLPLRCEFTSARRYLNDRVRPSECPTSGRCSIGYPTGSAIWTIQPQVDNEGNEGTAFSVRNGCLCVTIHHLHYCSLPGARTRGLHPTSGWGR